MTPLFTVPCTYPVRFRPQARHPPDAADSLRATFSLGGLQSAGHPAVRRHQHRHVSSVQFISGHFSSLQFTSVQDSIYALPKAHLLSTTSLRSFANVAFETVHVSADDNGFDGKPRQLSAGWNCTMAVFRGWLHDVHALVNASMFLV